MPLLCRSHSLFNSFGSTNLCEVDGVPFSFIHCRMIHHDISFLTFRRILLGFIHYMLFTSSFHFHLSTVFKCRSFEHTFLFYERTIRYRCYCSLDSRNCVFLFHFFLAILRNVFARLYLLLPGLHVGPPNLEPVHTPSVPLRLIEAVVFCIHLLLSVAMTISF